MNNFKELLIWQKSVDLSIKIYSVTNNFPSTEIYGLTSQIRRCAVSIPSNIAEGAGRNSNKDFINFLSIANGSSCELFTQLLIANRINLLDQTTFNILENDINEIQKMNRSLQN